MDWDGRGQQGAETGDKCDLGKKIQQKKDGKPQTSKETCGFVFLHLDVPPDMPKGHPIMAIRLFHEV